MTPFTPLPPRNRDDFKVAIICALPSEAENVQAVFDRCWSGEGKQYGKTLGDQNSYTTGLIGEHNVVLVHMPGMGNSSAAAVASSLRASFVKIQLALVVGVCGVVPIHPETKHEILLGDVVLSTAVIQYDFGRQYPHGFQRKKNVEDTLGRASPEIRGFLNMLQLHQNRQRLSENLQLLMKSETFQRGVPTAQYLGEDRDRLYEASYVHQHRSGVDCDKCHNNDIPCSKDCDDIGCETERIIVRDRHSASRFGDGPAIHFGRFGSSSSVMKSGLDRDRLAKDDRIAAFEMEGAGVWDQHPTILIKAACDYADSHKNKDWQAYAAAVAACCLKVFLREWTFPDQPTEEDGFPCSKSYIPFDPSPGFIGREDEIERLKSKQHRIVAILGLGGVGKSRLALELAYQIKSTRPQEWIFWIEATDRLTFEKDVRKIGQRLRIPGINDDKADVKNLVKQRLSDSSTNTERWLLILDNADDESLWGLHADTGPDSRTLVHHLPRTTNGSIIITTRSPNVAAFLAGKEVIELSTMSPHEGIEMFTKALRNLKIAHDYAATSSLLEKLAYLPLAIVQAASFLNMSGRPVQEYLHLLDQPEEQVIELLSYNFGDSTRYPNARNPVATTWLVSFNHMREHHELAAEFFSSMVCLNEKSIPRSLLPETRSEVEAIEVIAVLTGYSFVIRQTGTENLTASEETYDLHRLVHLAGRNWLRIESSLPQWTRTTMERMAERFPTREQQHKSAWTAYLPHARRLCDDQEAKDVTARYHLLTKMGLCFIIDGKYDEAVEAHRIVAEWREKTLGTSNIHTLLTYNDLGEALNWNGDWFAAEQYLHQAVEGLKKLLDPEHPDTLMCMTNLAMSFSNQGKWREAEKLGVDVLAARMRELGENNYLTSVSLSNLACTYWDQGRWKEAEEFRVQALNTELRILGPEDPSTLASMSNLAFNYQSQGRWNEAEKLELRVLETMKNIFEEDHPGTLSSMSGLASIYRSQGRWKEAEDLLVRVQEMSERVLGKEHPDTLTSVDHLAATYWSQGRYKQAEDLYSQVHKTRARVLGEKHPQTLTSASNLALTIQHQGRLDEAAKLQEEIIKTSKKVGGEEHFGTLTTTANLANTYRIQGQLNKAEELLLQVIAIRRRDYGEDHPDTLTNIGSLALVYGDQARYEEAETLELQVTEAMERTLGAEHPLTLTIMGNLALTHSYQQRWKEAEKLFKHVMETRKKVLGDNPTTVDSIEKLASMYRKQGRLWRWKEVAKLEKEAKEMRDRIQLP